MEVLKRSPSMDDDRASVGPSVSEIGTAILNAEKLELQRQIQELRESLEKQREESETLTQENQFCKRKINEQRDELSTCLSEMVRWQAVSDKRLKCLAAESTKRTQLKLRIQKAIAESPEMLNVAQIVQEQLESSSDVEADLIVPVNRVSASEAKPSVPENPVVVEKRASLLSEEGIPGPTSKMRSDYYLPEVTRDDSPDEPKEIGTKAHPGARMFGMVTKKMTSVLPEHVPQESRLQRCTSELVLTSAFRSLQVSDDPGPAKRRRPHRWKRQQTKEQEMQERGDPGQKQRVDQSERGPRRRADSDVSAITKGPRRLSGNWRHEDWYLPQPQARSVADQTDNTKREKRQTVGGRAAQPAREEAARHEKMKRQTVSGYKVKEEQAPKTGWVERTQPGWYEGHGESFNQEWYNSRAQNACAEQSWPAHMKRQQSEPHLRTHWQPRLRAGCP